MNTVTQTAQVANDYLSMMQAAAADFLARHQAEHLDNDELFERTVCHLITSRDVPLFLADRLVHLAMSCLLPPTTVSHRFTYQGQQARP